MCRRLKVRFPDNDDPHFWCPKRGCDAQPADVIEDCDGFVYMMDDERECKNCVNFKKSKYDKQLGACVKTNKVVYSYDYVCEDYEEIVEQR